MVHASFHVPVLIKESLQWVMLPCSLWLRSYVVNGLTPMNTERSHNNATHEALGPLPKQSPFGQVTQNLINETLLVNVAQPLCPLMIA